MVKKMTSQSTSSNQLVCVLGISAYKITSYNLFNFWFSHVNSENIVYVTSPPRIPTARVTNELVRRDTFV